LTINRTDDTFSPPAPSPRASDSVTHRVRNDVEATLERTERRDEVEPGHGKFLEKCSLHKAQLADIHKKAKMVDNRIDKLNDGVEKLRQQWSEVEREKAVLLTSKERYQQKIAAQRKVVYRDDVTAKKYDNYLNLVAEVLVLDDSDDDEVEDSIMYDWGEQGQGGGREAHEQEQ
jgi:hypothetical protein